MSADPVLVTTAGLNAAADRRERTRRYLLTQGVRVVCVLLSVLLPVPVVWKLGFIAASVVLPWFGVVAANAGPAAERRRLERVAPGRDAGAAPALPAAAARHDGPRVIDGTVEAVPRPGGAGGDRGGPA